MKKILDFRNRSYSDVSGKYQNMEKPLKHQRRLGISATKRYKTPALSSPPLDVGGRMTEAPQHLVFFVAGFRITFSIGLQLSPKQKKKQSCPDLCKTKMEGMCQYQRTWPIFSSSFLPDEKRPIKEGIDNI